MFERYKMNEIIKKSLLAGDKLMYEMHLRQPRFTYNACGPFSKPKNKYKNLKKQKLLRYIYQKKLNKMTCLMEILKIY